VGVGIEGVEIAGVGIEGVEIAGVGIEGINSNRIGGGYVEGRIKSIGIGGVL